MRIGDIDIGPREKKILAVSAGLAVTGFFILKTLFGEDIQLAMADTNYEEKCYSYNQNSDLKNSTALSKSEEILTLISRFKVAGNELAEDIKRSGHGFCFDMDEDSLTPLGHWSRLKYYFAASTYPKELVANYIYTPRRDQHWNSRVVDAGKLNTYTFESGLLFSRAQRAAKLAHELVDIQRAIGSSYRTKEDNPWSTYLNDNPEQADVVGAFVETYKKNLSYEEASLAASLLYMKDANALERSDNAYLSEYLSHVSILPSSSYENIYRGPQSGDYAIIDADRDGDHDDVIFMGYGRKAKEYYYDSYDSLRGDLRRKYETVIVTYSCGTADNPRTCTRPESRSVEKTVYYDEIPAADTATLDLAPQTLVALANISGLPFLKEDVVKGILSDGIYLTPSSEQNAALTAKIYEQIATNIPNRDNNVPAPGLGLIAIPK